MRKFINTAIAACLIFFAGAQSGKNINLISTDEVRRIETVLSSDAMEGRKPFTASIDRAAVFIADEFRKAGLQPLTGSKTFIQPFSMVRTKFMSATATFDAAPIDQKNIMIFTSQPDLNINERSGYTFADITKGATFNQEVSKYVYSGKNYIVLVDSSFAANFPRLARMKSQAFKADNSVVFILGSLKPQQFYISAKHEITEQKLANVVGVIPGKTKPGEYVIFSGHYDHLGIGKPVNGDSIYNGANDDAAGTTAVIMLANYYKKLNNNNRTLVFVAFTAEEMGGFGSQYFSRQFDPAKVIAMFNLEMIGTESKWGKNSAYITGYEKTDMGKILQSNLEGTLFQFYPDPYTQQNLFYRSDNATLARLGVPAHTISTSKMDSEPNYHKVSDEISTLDMDNMAEIIKAIAISAQSIISGKDTPSRVDTSQLR
ncbi:MAG: aminopeptidase [Chitinophagaceae bacterium]|nr:aminopeptidase [Chitinophagaceae bacterium]